MSFIWSYFFPTQPIQPEVSSSSSSSQTSQTTMQTALPVRRTYTEVVVQGVALESIAELSEEIFGRPCYAPITNPSHLSIDSSCQESVDENFDESVDEIANQESINESDESDIEESFWFRQGKQDDFIQSKLEKEQDFSVTSPFKRRISFLQTSKVWLKERRKDNHAKFKNCDLIEKMALKRELELHRKTAKLIRNEERALK